jgi:hypothetical protein
MMAARIRTDPRNLAQQFPGLVLFGFLQQIPTDFLAQGAQDIQLLIVVFGASPHAGFANLGEPFRTMTRSMQRVYSPRAGGSWPSPVF